MGNPMRIAFALATLSLGAASAGACGSSTALPRATGSGGEVALGGAGGGGGPSDGGGGTSAVPPIECTSEPGDTAALCEGLDPCPITLDRVVSCDGDLRDPFVLSTPADVLLGGLAEESQLRVWSVAPSDLHEIQGLPAFNYSFPKATVDEQGNAHVFAQTLPRGERGTDTDGRLFRRDATGFVSIAPPTRKLSWFRIDPAGDLHFWGRSQSGEDRHHWGTPAAGWQVEPVVSPHDIGNPLPDLSADGAPISYAAADIALALRLYVRVDGMNRELGADMGSGYDPFTPFGLATPAPPAGASRYGAVLAREQGLSVAWAGTAGWGELPVADTAPYTSPCSSACPQDCPVIGRVVHRENHVPVRASSGALWLPHLVTELDALLRYTASSDSPTGCSVATVFDDSTFELVLSRVALDGSAVQTMLRIPNLEASSLSAGDSDPNLWAHAYGDDLAIALYLPSEEGRRYRVLRLDASLLVAEP